MGGATGAGKGTQTQFTTGAWPHCPAASDSELLTTPEMKSGRGRADGATGVITILLSTS